MALRFPPRLLSILLYFYSSQSTLFIETDSHPSPLDLDQMAKEPVHIFITGAAGQIRYTIVPMIARGVMLGPNQPAILHILDIQPATDALNVVKMELVDATFPLLKGVVAMTDVVEACTGVNIAVMVGRFPRKQLDHNRALGHISKGLNVQVSDVKNVVIWGNHSSTQYLDVNHATVKTHLGVKPVPELVVDDAW
ncbi:hypothetical protein CIPAW_11G065700 [Carya illinoinensis]|uniref:malate dehydrogenase n=1 Tax=Carya illinoinensis TaxID=32201 RepID=A0A8T1P0H8_CARIL|nr:hypothetical protein CIPAW_11G065700 [Carya illinoinensis]